MILFYHIKIDKDITTIILRYMQHETINKILEDITNDKVKFASGADKINFLTDNIQKINKKKIISLDTSVDRISTIGKFTSILKDIEAAIKLEAGIFEFALIYSTTKNLSSKMMPAIYTDKTFDLITNLEENNLIDNKYLRKAILNGKINPQVVPFLTPQDLHPERWKDLIRKKNLREDKKKNIATTDLYQCWKCKGRRCRMFEMQTRGADEPYLFRVEKWSAIDIWIILWITQLAFHLYFLKGIKRPLVI